MDQPQAILAGDFFRPASLGGFIGLAIAVTILVTVALKNDWDKELLQYKEALFNSLFLTGDTPHTPKHYPQEAVSAARNLQQEFQERKEIDSVVAETLAFAVVYEHLSAENAKKFADLLLKSKLVPKFILELTQDWRWRAVAESNTDLKIIGSLLKGKKVAFPAFYYDYPSISGKMLLGMVFMIQFCAFGCYLIRRRYLNARRYYNDDRRWYHIPWGKPGTYITALFFVPGALPLIFVAGFFSFCSVDLKTKVVAWQKSRSQKADLGASQRSNFDSGEALLIRLQERIKEK